MAGKKIGIRMHDLGKCEPQELAEKMMLLGLHYGQLAIPKAIHGIASYRDVKDALLERLRIQFKKADIHIAVLGCYISPMHSDEAGAAQNMEIFRHGIRCAAALQAGCIGTETPLDGYCGSENQFFDVLCKRVELMLDAARPYGVQVALEPVCTHALKTPEITHRLLQKFRGENIAIIFDPVNLLQPNVVQQQQALWKECMDAFGSSIVACHMKDVTYDCENKKWTECMLGRGQLNFESLGQALSNLIVEVPLLREGFCLKNNVEELAFLDEFVDMYF